MLGPKRIYNLTMFTALVIFFQSFRTYGEECSPWPVRTADQKWVAHGLFRVQWGKRSELCKSIQFRLIGGLPRKGAPRKIPKDFNPKIIFNKLNSEKSEKCQGNTSSNSCASAR